MRPLKEMHRLSILGKNKRNPDFDSKSNEEENIEKNELTEINKNETKSIDRESLIDDNRKNINSEIEDFFDDYNTRKTKQNQTISKENEKIKPSIKSLIKKDIKGKPVFLEDTGEKIGIVFDMISDSKDNLIGYKIKDNKSESTLNFPISQFDEDKNGLIFIPSWYTKGLKTIEELEFKDRISPELGWLINDNTISGEELYNIFVKHDDKIKEYMDKASSLDTLLENRLKLLEKERVKLKDDLMDLTEKRLIKDIDRRKFSEIVMKHRRKVNVLDVNIKKCNELINRLENTSFGALNNNIIFYGKSGGTENIGNMEKINGKSATSKDKKNLEVYKNKYLDLNKQHKELQEKYNELKEAVEKVVSKNLT